MLLRFRTTEKIDVSIIENLEGGMGKGRPENSAGELQSKVIRINDIYKKTEARDGSEKKKHDTLKYCSLSYKL